MHRSTCDTGRLVQLIVQGDFYLIFIQQHGSAVKLVNILHYKKEEKKKKKRREKAAVTRLESHATREQ